jgi:hypothetical protein
MRLTNLRTFKSASVGTPFDADFDFGNTTTGTQLHLAYSAPPQPATFHFTASEPPIHVTSFTHSPKEMHEATKYHHLAYP